MEGIEILIDRFLTEKEAIGLSLESLYYYKRNLALFYKFICDRHITDNTFIDYQLWLENNLQIKKVSIQTYARATKVFLRWLNANKYITIDIDKIKLIKADKNIIYPLTDREINLLLNTFDNDILGERNRLICMLMLDCGLRRAELTKLQKQHFYSDTNTLLINGKGSKQRLVHLGNTVIKQLKLYQSIYDNNTNYLLLNIHGEPLTKNAIKMMFSRLKKEPGLERIYPHLLRHTFATNYILDGGELESLRIIMGHENITTTQKYLHIANQIQVIKSNNSHLDRIYNNTQTEQSNIDLIFEKLNKLEFNIKELNSNFSNKQNIHIV